MSGDEQKNIKRRDVERALSRALKSEQFVNSAQLSDFLSFIVTKTLDGKSSEIKAYTIAVDALGRGEDFDSQTNPAVRVAAGRLRQSLALFNAHESKNGSSTGALVKIILKPGSYTPTFEVEETPTDPLTSAVEGYISLDEADMLVEDTAFNKVPLESLEKNKHQPVAPPLVAAPSTPATLERGGDKKSKRGLSLNNVALIIGLALLTAALGAYVQSNWGGSKNKPVAQTSPKAPVLHQINLRPKITSTFIQPDGPYPDWFGLGEVGDSIELTLSRFDDFQFVGAVSHEAFPLNDHRSADYHLLITARKRGDNVRVFGRLIRERDSTVIWSSERMFVKPLSITDRNVPAITGTILSPVASPYGVIYTDLLRPKPTADSNASGQEKLACTISNYKFFINRTYPELEKARSCSEKLVDRGVLLPTVFAGLSFLYMEDYLEHQSPPKTNTLKLADKMVLKAIQYGPQSARAYQALARIHQVRGHFDSANKAVEKALALNPYDATILGDYAALLISIGDFEEGKKRLLEAEALLGTRSSKMEAYKFLILDLTDNQKTADEIAAHMDYSRSLLSAYAVAVSAHRLGDAILRKRAVDHILKVMPSLAKNPKAGFMKRGFAVSVATLLEQKLKIVQNAVADANQN